MSVSLLPTAGELAEDIAVATGLVYVLLILWRNRWGWVASAVSSTLYVVLMARARLPMQALLNGYYVAMAVYGWISWTRNANLDGGRIGRWPARRHVLAIGAIALFGLLWAAWLARHSDAAWPRLDSLVTVTCLFASFLVARSVLENWLYWMAADVLSVFMFIEQRLWKTAALYAAYIVIAAFGLRSWYLRYRVQRPPA